MTLNHTKGEVPEYLDERAVARLMNISVKWLQKRRSEGGGPPFLKFGRLVRYAKHDVVSFAQEQTRRNTSDNG